MKDQNPRQIALDILVDVNKNKAYSNIAINRRFKATKIEIVDRKLITELVYGVIENLIYLDHIIKTLSKIRIKKLNVSVLNILRMGLYQIIFLDKIPVFAAVNESVNLTKKNDHKSAGFVNGILRNYTRNMNDISIPSLETDPVNHLSIVYSHPNWLVDKWLRQFGQEKTILLLKANNEKPPLTIRVNTLKTSKNHLKNILIDENLEISDGLYMDEAIHINNVGSIEELDSFQQGLFQVQDESSMMVARILDPQKGDAVIDVCAAPGGKTTHIAQLMEDTGYILARDIYDHKLKLINDNAGRLGIHIIHTQTYDAKELDKDSIEKFDKVLVDAPCTGLGIIRRKPELKYNKTPENLMEIAELQFEILSNSSKYVKKGGILLYSTCTITNEENHGVVERFLYHNKDFEISDINAYLPKELNTKGIGLQLYPHLHKTDGFFISKLRKKL